MKDSFFIDTNILIYAFSEDEKEKQAIANNLLVKKNGSIIISTQVINEFSNILFKKFNLSSDSVENVMLELDSNIPIVGFDITTQIKAIRLKEKYQLQFYDALIIATALENKCTYLFSEDMQHLQIIEQTITIVNPFKSENFVI